MYGEGNSYTAEFWQYDARIGRRWNLDPEMAKYPNVSPYATFFDNPVFYSDPLGNDPDPPASRGQAVWQGVKSGAQNFATGLLWALSGPGIGIKTAINAYNTIQKYRSQEKDANGNTTGLDDVAQSLTGHIPTANIFWAPYRTGQSYQKDGENAAIKTGTEKYVEHLMTGALLIAMHQITTPKNSSTSSTGGSTPEANYTSPTTTEELFELAAEQEVTGKPFFEAGNYKMYGSGGMNGSTMVFDIYYVEGSGSLGGFRGLMNAVESYAKNSGATEIQINGSDVVSNNLRSIFGDVNKVSKFGYSVSGGASSGAAVTLKKTLTQ